MNPRRLLLCAVLWCSAWSGCSGPPQREVVPSTGFDGTGLRYGLFIGIDRYPRMEGKDLKGCVNDAVSLQTLFREHFGVDHWQLLTNEQATRQGIQRAFRDLVEAVRRRSRDLAQGEAVSVVITYAGHGSQVQNQETDTEDEADDGKDESWVAHDSTFATGENDIRDDEIEAVWAELLGLGAQVVLISDSCHSGTMHRGQEFGLARALEPGDAPRPGPPQDLFPEYARPPAAADGTPEPVPGFVLFSACMDHQIARECVDDEGYPCGRLSYMLRRVLGTLPRNATYQDVYQEVVQGFDNEWPTRTQYPQLHVGADKADELFLRGGYPTMHASVLRIEGDRALLDMGRAHGVTGDATFEFFASLDDLERRGPVRSVARVVGAVELARCWVQGDGTGPDPALRQDWKARLHAVHEAGFPVQVGPGLPDVVRQELEALAEEGQITLAGDFHRVSIQAVSDPPCLRVHAPDAVPDAARGLDPAPLVQIDGHDATAARALARWLRDRAGVQRILSLDAGDGLLRSRVVVPDDGAPRPPGIPRLKDQEDFAVEIQNDGAQDLYVHVLGFKVPPGGADSLARDVFVVYPFAGYVHDRLEAGGSFTIDLHAEAAAELERHQLKIIAATTPLNLKRLIADRGAADDADPAESPQAKGLEDLLGGIRGQTRGSDGPTWATDTVVFEIEAAGGTRDGP